MQFDGSDLGDEAAGPSLLLKSGIWPGVVSELWDMRWLAWIPLLDVEY